MCLPYDDIKRFLHYYAGKFQSKDFEHWELVNEAWIGIHGLTNPHYVSNGIRWAIQCYKAKMHRQKHKGKPKSFIQSIDEAVVDGLFLKDILVAPVHKKEVDNRAYVGCLLRNPKLKLEDKLLIDQRYFQGLTMPQIGKIHGVTKQAISLKLQKVVRVLGRNTNAMNFEGEEVLR